MAITVGGTPVRDGSVIDEGTTVNVGVSGLLTPGTATRVLQASLDDGMKYTAGGAEAPEGWNIEYSTDDGDTWTGTEPTPAADVTDVRASASVTAGAITGYSQRYTSSTVAAIPSSTFTGSTGGDGWDVFFSDDFVFNIFHHNDGAVVLDCHSRTTGNRCAGYTATFSGYRAGMRSGGWVDTVSGELYAFTAETATGRPGVLCIDITSTPTSCGFTALSADTSVTYYGYLSEAESIGRRVFGIETAGTGSLLCFDAALGTACPGSPIALDGAVGTTGDDGASRVLALGDRIIAKTQTRMYCFDATTLTPCAGTWPATINGNQKTPIAPHSDGQGELDGVCWYGGCIDLTGATAAWTNPWSLGDNNWAMHAMVGAYTQDRFFSVGNDQYQVNCFDYSTNSACPNFPITYPGYFNIIYAVRVDPVNPSCMWINSDGGQIRVFDAFSGANECTANPVITLQPSSFAPRFTCSTQNGIDEWRSLELVGFAGTGTPSTVTLTVRNAQGGIVPGWGAKPVEIGEPLDMTGLDVTQSGSRPTFSFAFGGVTGGNITTATIDLDYAGKGPELCVRTQLATALQCPVVVGLDGHLFDGTGPQQQTFAVHREFTVGTDVSLCPENIVPQTVPSAPRDPQSSVSSGTATITFLPPLDDGGAELREYKYSIDGGQTWATPTVGTLPNGRSTFTIPGLTPGTYPFELKATNVIGRSAAATLSIVVSAKAVQVITIPGLGDIPIDEGPVTLPATTGDGLPLTYTASPADVCSVDGNVLSLLAEGTCTVTANQAGDDSHEPGSTTVTFVVQPPRLELELALEAGKPVSSSPIAVRGAGLKPGSTVRVELHSDPVLLGTAVVQQDGTFETTVYMPQIVPPGNHDIIAIGVRPDDQEVRTEHPLFVDWAGSLGEPEPDGGYTPIVATRILDTRESGGRQAAGTARRLVVPADLIPADTTAITANLTVTDATRAGFATVYPCATDRPWASSITFAAAESISTTVETRYQRGDELCLFVTADAHLVVDLVGAHHTSGTGHLQPLTQTRLVDTRETAPVAADGVLELTVIGDGRAPVGSTAVILNVGTVDPQRAGFATAYPCGTERPWASSLNHGAGETISNDVVVKVGDGGKVCLYTRSATDLVVDLEAAVTPAATDWFTALVPGRLADTRLTGGTKVAAGEVRAWTVVGDEAAPAGTSAVSLKVTVTEPERAGFVTVYPCGSTMPWVSTIDFRAGETISGHTTVAADDDGRVCVYSSAATHVVIDVEGTYGHGDA